MKSLSNTLKISAALVFGVALFACAAKTPSPELVEARRAYEQASRSAAEELEPARLLSAKQALEAAERAHREDAQSARERTLAYVAEREAQLAMTYGNIAQAKQQEQQANRDYIETQGRLRRQAEEQLGKTREEYERAQTEISKRDEQLRAGQQVLTQREQELEAERKAREAAEAEAQAAIDSLKRIAEVKEESRGTVITLSGEVLFETGKAVLLPIARQRLQEVATALKDNSDRTIAIYGHTDSRGSDSKNMELSQARADAVRSFFIEQQIEPSRITAVGKGEQEPIASNENAEGRANNRRVEIVVENEAA